MFKYFWKEIAMIAPEMLHSAGCSCDMLGTYAVLYTLPYNGKVHEWGPKHTKGFQENSFMTMNIKEINH